MRFLINEMSLKIAGIVIIFIGVVLVWFKIESVKSSKILFIIMTVSVFLAMIELLDMYFTKDETKLSLPIS